MDAFDPAGPQPPPAPHERRGAFRLLFWALLAIGAGNTMLIAAIIPPLVRELQMPDWTGGAIFSLSALFWSLSSPFWGKRSNEWGRRRVAAIGMFGYAVSMSLVGLSAWAGLTGRVEGVVTVFVCLALSRTLFGLLGSAASPAAQAYVADRTSPEERQEEIASITAAFSFGTVVGPSFAAALVAALGLLSPIWITAGYAAFMGVVILTRLPETRQPQTRAGAREAIPGAAGLWRSPVVLPYLFFAVLLSLATGVLTQTYPFAVMDKLGLEGRDVAAFTGPAFTVGAVGVLLSQLVLIPRLKLSNRTLMIAGCLPAALGAVLVLLTANYGVLVFAQFLIGSGQGLMRPGFSSGASLAVSPELQGNVAGLVISANGVGFIVTPFFGLFFYQYVGTWVPFLLCAVLLAAMAVFAAVALKADGPGEAGAPPAR